MWNYIYYVAYIKFKEPTEYNGDETYISEKIANYDLGWVPVKRT